MRPRAALLLTLLLGNHAGGGDSLEPRSDHGGKCRNSVQGRSRLLDENGWLCELANVDWETGCCAAGRAAEERYSCRTCEEETKCCEVYENCVGCCMKPENEGERHEAMQAAKSKKTFQKAVAANDAFEFCRASCRTSSMSTVHGNAYISEKKHCLSPVPVTAGKFPADVKTVSGAQGESCDAVCAKKGWHCDGRFISSINNCDILTKHFPCSMTNCLKNYGHDQPAYVSNQANKEMYGKCLVNEKESYYSCSGQHLDTSRVCPCRKGPKTKTSYLGFGAKSLLEETEIHEAPSAGEDGVLLERIDMDPGLVV